MSELKRYGGYDIALRDINAEIYLCSDIDPKLDEIARLKNEIKELKLTLGWGSIVTDNLILRPTDKEYIIQGYKFVKQADEAAK